MSKVAQHEEPSAIPPKHIGWIIEQPLPTIRLLRWPRKLKHSLITQTQEPFPFLRLPFDIRHQIYHHALVHHSAIQISPTAPPTATSLALIDAVHTRPTRKSHRQSLAVNLLQTSRRVNAEAAPVLYAANTFHAGASRGAWLRLDSFLAQIGPANVRRLTSVVVAPPADDFKLCLRPRLPAAVGWLAAPCRVLAGAVSLGVVSDVLQVCEVWYSDAGVFDAVCRRLAAGGGEHALRFEDVLVTGPEVRDSVIKRRAVVIAKTEERKAKAGSEAVSEDEDVLMVKGEGEWGIESSYYYLPDDESSVGLGDPVCTDLWLPPLGFR